VNVIRRFEEKRDIVLGEEEGVYRQRFESGI